MCDGNPSILVTSKGQTIGDKDTNSHSLLAEKYLGSSREEDRNFQPELDMKHGKIKVNSTVTLSSGKIIDINDRIGKSILIYFNKYFNTVVKIREAIQKTRKHNKTNWTNVWMYFPNVLEEGARDSLEGLKEEKKLLTAMELSKDVKNLRHPWNKNRWQFKLEDILNKNNGQALFQ